jgi:dTMP kinase
MGQLIVFEGLDGSGKTTQISLLKDFLEQKGQQVISTREPGGTNFVEKCRDLFLTDGITGISEAFIAFASRVEHINDVINPALKDGMWVLCDRFSDSTLAYQGYGRGVDLNTLNHLVDFIERNLPSYTTIYMDSHLEGIKKRISNRETKDKKFDEETYDFFSRVRNGYEEIMKKKGDGALIINGNKNINEVFENIVSGVTEIANLK